MVEQPFYEAETHGSTHVRYTDLCDAINEYGVRRKDKRNLQHGRNVSDAYAEITVESWANGPLLLIQEYDSDGTVTRPTIGNGITMAIFHEGYVPWGFRPERRDGEHTGRWLWYLRPVEDITDENNSMHDTAYAIKTPEGDTEYLRKTSGAMFTFDVRENAEAIAAPNGDVVEVDD